MNDLNRALVDISSIRRQVANASEFRGYGPATLAATGAFAILAAVVQDLWLPLAQNHVTLYLAIWITTAVLSGMLTGVQMHTRARRLHSGMSDEMIRMAVEQFMPSLSAGLLLTVVIVGSVPQACWMLPGLWQIIFSLGIFSSCRFLPKPMIAAAFWYLLTGLSCVAIGNVHALSPWTMAIPFGVGQLGIAAILRLAAPGVQDEN